LGERAGAKLELRTDPEPNAEWSGERSMNIIDDSRKRNPRKDDPKDTLYEPRISAVKRLRALTEEACKVLPTQQLGVLSYTMSAHLDGATGTLHHIDGMKADLDAFRKQRTSLKLVRRKR
jgi:hypothetical protein